MTKDTCCVRYTCVSVCAHVCVSLCVHACAHACMSVHIRYPLPDVCSIRVSVCVCTGTDSVPRYSEWVSPSHWRESWVDLYPGAAIYQPCFLSKFCCFSEPQFFTYSVVCPILTTKGTVVFSHFAILAIKLKSTVFTQNLVMLETLQQDLSPKQPTLVSKCRDSPHEKMNCLD